MFIGRLRQYMNGNARRAKATTSYGMLYGFIRETRKKHHIRHLIHYSGEYLLNFRVHRMICLDRADSHI